METRKANTLNNTQDVKTGQAQEMRAENVFYEQYLNMSDAEIEKLRSKRQARLSSSGQVFKTYVPEEFKNPNLYYEWVIYNPVAVDQRIKDGWIVVANEKLAKLKGCSTTSEVKIPSGLSNDHGDPEYLILMAIHKKLHDDDVAAQKQRIKDFDENISTGKSIVDDKGQQIKEQLEIKEVSVE